MDLSIENVEKCLQYKTAEQRDVLKQFFTNPQRIDHSKKIVIFSTPSETGTSFFRVFEPMRVLWKHYRDEINLIYTECLQPNHLKLANCIIMHRAGNLHTHFTQAVKMWPKSEISPYVIHDVDDNEFNLPKTHPMYDLWYSSEKDKMSIYSLKHSHCITTTTRKLQKTFKTLNPNVEIFKNQFDWELPQWNLDKEETRNEMLPEWKDKKDKIVIGWAGLTSHFEDIKRMHACLKKIHDKYPQTVFVLAGMALKDSSVEVIEDEYGNKKYKEIDSIAEEDKYASRVARVYDDFDPKRIKLFDAVGLEEYAKFYTLFDISLAYIEHNTFNSCKSEIKVVESLHYGAIPVFSDYGGYQDYWRAVPSNLKQKHMCINSMFPKRWADSIEHWVKEIIRLKVFQPSVMSTTEALTKPLREYTDLAYDLNEGAEDRLQWLIEKTETHEENQTNYIASITTRKGV